MYVHDERLFEEKQWIYRSINLQDMKANVSIYTKNSKSFLNGESQIRAKCESTKFETESFQYEINMDSLLFKIIHNKVINLQLINQIWSTLANNLSLSLQAFGRVS